MKEYKHVIKAWPSRRIMADDLAVNLKTVQLWYFRNSIPVRYWPDIIEAGNRRGIRLSSDELLRIDARSRENIPAMGQQIEGESRS